MNLQDYLEQATTMVKKVKNAVMNYTEYEAKVRDATNNDPWGTSSTLMMDIANATSHYGHFNDIMNTIYKRFQEPAGPTWRQTYKSLQLLEYLIKNGSEKVIDSARGHVYDLRALLSYTYVDDKKKDQGMNVKNRAKEIIELLENDEKLRTERIKAKENRSKYVGVDSSSISSFDRGSAGGGSGTKYGGFGSGSGSMPRNGISSGSFSDSFRDSASGRAADLPLPVSQQRQDQQPFDRPAEQKPAVTAPHIQSAVQPTVNLLDLDSGDDWSNLSGAAVQPTSNSATNNGTGFGSFASFPNPQQPSIGASSNGGFASFPNPQQPSIGASSNGGFASFSNPQQPPPLTQQHPSASDFGDFTSFVSAPTTYANTQPQQTIYPAQSLVSPTNGFTQFSTMQPMTTPTKPNTTDTFSKLVSLDVNALTPGSKKKEPAMPSLNALGNNGEPTTSMRYGNPMIPSPVNGAMQAKPSQQPQLFF
ncbi:Epsin-3, clathrin recruitment and traffic between the Golgi and endosome [Batrachochytrium dendrobatidis]|nr:Epsin-3, clathrin recruitment and traffic between the Golgi and endosome [Batrachochytrium dendrobatidis]